MDPLTILAVAQTAYSGLKVGIEGNVVIAYPDHKNLTFNVEDK